MARPKKMTGPRRKVFLAQYSETLNKTEAAEAAGLSRHTVNRELESNPAFEAEVIAAEDAFVDRFFGLYVKYSMVGVPFEEEHLNAAGNVVKRRKGARIMPAMMHRCFSMIERRQAAAIAAASPGPASGKVTSLEKREQARKLADLLSYDELVELDTLDQQRDQIEDKRAQLLSRADAS